ncbi:polymer-forming cytoskeletal protein [Acidocella sp.]|uniref:bactofilin family protein n=1 Tax=Acidocella sp. TaxID=50710 RepID=UPI0025BB3E50|nr:polymer-forming cytoskeletal protein [Acidocella sp.]
MFNKRKPEEPKPAAPPLPAAETPAPPAPAAGPDDATAAVTAQYNFKETPMARSPFTPHMPAPATAAVPARSTVSSTAAATPRDDGQRRTLVVGRGISVQGTVQDAERLVVEGTVEAAMINGLVELSIAQGGLFKGEVEVDEAEVAGTIDGTLVARHALIVRSSGRVLGTARCRRLQVEDGGQITGRIEMMTDTGIPAHED